MRQTPGRQGVWDNVQFTVDPVEKCDFVVMLNNNMTCGSTVCCPKENVWVLMQEPYVRGFTDWMAEGHEYFYHVLTHHIPSADPKYVVSHPALPWHVNKSFDQLSQMDILPKLKTISWIAGNALNIPGHFKRLSFLQYLQKKSPVDIELYGRAVHAIEDKWDGLAPYKYSLAIENSCSPDYWTEKVADCFLSWTVPFYYGCTNLEAYFPEESFIRIDIEQPEIAVDLIESAVKNNEWEKRLPALKMARDLILHQYQFFPHLAGQIRSHRLNSENKIVTLIPPYRKSIKTNLNRALFKVMMAAMRCKYRMSSVY
ncbi:MAG: hypothetical protein JW943_07040 [Deltaproteobacteria bacterium]|nr:hypothetical protein [Deltaproteobacteria bacterium]